MVKLEYWLYTLILQTVPHLQISFMLVHSLQNRNMAIVGAKIGFSCCRSILCPLILLYFPHLHHFGFTMI